MMAALLEIVASWQSLTAFLTAVALFGFFPGFLLRILVRIYPAGDPRRRELPAELYVVPRLLRPFWVAEQFETALHEGTALRYRARRTRRFAEQLSADGLAALDAEVLRAIEESGAADDDMVFVDFGATILITQRVGAVRRGTRPSRRARVPAAIRRLLLSRRRKSYIRDLRLRFTARVEPAVNRPVGESDNRAPAVRTGNPGREIAAELLRTR
ncbi:MAG: hypothetical protein HOQ44_24685 [Nocardia sp.]|nr:hypothetical protein [Nocardia sp.]